MKVYVITLMESNVNGHSLNGSLGVWNVCDSYEKAMLKVGKLIDEYNEKILAIVRLGDNGCIIHTDCSEWRIEGCEVE